MQDISLKNIKKSFGQTEVLKNINLEIRGGEFLTLVGASGSGKSTLLRIISGLEEQSFGLVRINGEDISARHPKDRNLAMVFQSYALYPHLSVYENMQVPLKMRIPGWQRLPFASTLWPTARSNMHYINQRVREVAKQLRIEHLLDRKPGELSGGQCQRVALGRAMVRKPAAFLMDEPLSNLDAELRVHMRGELTLLHKQLNTTFIYVTHDQIEAMTMSDRIALLVEGELMQVDTPHNMYNNPAHLKVAEFIGSPKINVIPAKAGHDGELCFFGKVLPGLKVNSISPESKISIGIRPEDIKFVEQSELQANIVHIENMGGEKIVFVESEWISGRIAVKLPSEQAEGMQQGDGVSLRIKKKKLMLFDALGNRIQKQNIYIC